MFKTLFTLFLFAGVAFAQDIYIGSPAENQSVTAGANLTVQIRQPIFLAGAIDQISVAIGVESCPSGRCSPPLVNIGNLLFIGPFVPVSNDPTSPPYQNFTVRVPTSTPTGTASLNAASFSSGLSDELVPKILTASQTIKIVD